MPTVKQIAQLVGGKLSGPDEVEIVGAAPPADAQPGDIVFILSEKEAPLLESTRASAAIVPEGVSAEGLSLVSVADPRLAMAQVLALFAPEHEVPAGVHPSAQVAEDAELAPDVRVGPLAVICPRAKIGRGTLIYGQVYIGEGAQVGEQCVIYPQVSLLREVRLGDRCIVHSGARIGGDGFGYAFHAGVHHKVPQLGTVIIGDDVEIGANATIDRATLPGTATVIGPGTKIDDQVHIAHNCEIGAACVLCGQVGLAGSVRIDDGAVLAGQVGVADHVHIGAGAQIGAQAGVISDVPAGAVYSGFPARPHRQQMRAAAELERLAELRKRVRQLEARLAQLEQASKPGESKQ